MSVYPVEPCSGRFVIGSPLFRSIKVFARMNKPSERVAKATHVFSALAPANSAFSPYVKSVRVNGSAPLSTHSYFVDPSCFATVMTNPCVLEFEM